jgi:hypothetical protein
LGFTVPFKVAEVDPTLVAAVVVTMGSEALRLVVNEKTEP